MRVQYNITILLSKRELRSPKHIEQSTQIFVFVM